MKHGRNFLGFIFATLYLASCSSVIVYHNLVQDASLPKAQLVTLEYPGFTIPITDIDGQAVEFDARLQTTNHYIVGPSVHPSLIGHG